jgi:DNA modification methylase
MIELDRIYNEDCLLGMKRIDTASVDCIVTDPPYELENQGGGFWSKNEDPTVNHYNARGTRKGMDKLGDIKDGITDDVLDEMCRVMKHINIYIFCSQKQIQQYLDYFVTRRGCNWNLLTWHKTNPIPACGNKYLSDTEFILFFREKGVKIFGSYETKRTFYTSLRNQEDNVRYKHPTVKPLQIIRNFVVNSTEPDAVILDPFICSGTTAVAALMEKRHFIGFETNKEYFDIAQGRIDQVLRNPTLF